MARKIDGKHKSVARSLFMGASAFALIALAMAVTGSGHSRVATAVIGAAIGCFAAGIMALFIGVLDAYLAR